MSNRLSFLSGALGAGFAFSWPGAGLANTAPALPAPSEFKGAWSKAVDGLQGRLVVRPEDLHPGRRYAVTLELRNVGIQPLSVTNQPDIAASLHGADGREVATQGHSMSGPLPFPQTAVLPRDAYLGFRADMQTVGVPVHGPRLLALGGKTWALSSGRYVLRATVRMQQQGSPGSGAWSGRLELPPVSITNKFGSLR